MKGPDREPRTRAGPIYVTSSRDVLVRKRAADRRRPGELESRRPDRAARGESASNIPIVQLVRAFHDILSRWQAYVSSGPAETRRGPLDVEQV